MLLVVGLERTEFLKCMHMYAQLAFLFFIIGNAHANMIYWCTYTYINLLLPHDTESSLSVIRQLADPSARSLQQTNNPKE